MCSSDLLSPIAMAEAKSCEPVKIGTVRFTGNSAKLTNLQKWRIRDMAYSVRASTCSVVTVNGYDAKTPGRTRTKALLVSRARAKVVATYLGGRLTLLGVDAEIGWAGYGRSNPVATNSTSSGRAKNRRAEILASDS